MNADISNRPRLSPEDKYARNVFTKLDAIQANVAEKASMLTEAGGSPAFQQAVAASAKAFMHHVADPDTDLDTVDIHGWPWPKPEDFPEEAPVLTLSEALDESIEDNPDLFDEAPADPDAELAAENERLRARVAELEASPPPSPAVVALEGMEALKAKLDAGRVHPEIAALLSEGETAPDAIERLTPDEDALLDLAASLSDEALGEALRAIPRSAREKWMEGLHGTHADLRLKRGTDKENLTREAQVTRMMTLLGRVGEKR